LPDGTRESIVIRSSVDIGILEAGLDKRAILGVVAHQGDLGGVDVLVQVVVEVDVDGHAGRQVELAVQRAGAVAGLDGVGRRELVHPAGAGGRVVQARLDAVALVLDLREGQVDLGHDAGYVKATDVADTALVLGVEVGADLWETGVVVADGDGAGRDADGEDGGQDGDGG